MELRGAKRVWLLLKRKSLCLSSQMESEKGEKNRGIQKKGYSDV